MRNQAATQVESAVDEAGATVDKITGARIDRCTTPESVHIARFRTLTFPPAE
jgi:hypothetical protein